MKFSRRVVVTGIGAVTPLGNNVRDTWESIKKGESGISYLPEFKIPGLDLSQLSCRIGGIINNFNPSLYFDKKDIRRYDPFIQYGVASCEEAWEDSGVHVDSDNGSRIGISMSSGIGGIQTIEYNRYLIDIGKFKKISPFCIPSTIINMISGYFSIKYGLRGPNLSIVTACATGSHNIGTSARLIACGDADIMIAGGSDKATTAIGIGGFSAIRALSKSLCPKTASRPWDKQRDGFVLSDGSASVVLEEYEHAKRRKAEIYAELVGFGMNSDASHITKPKVDGAYECMKLALKDAQISISDIDYINAHATSTIVGDHNESQAIERLIGSSSKNIPVSSTKSMTGHMLGASGALEAIISILSISEGIIPPTINIDEADQGCNLDYVPEHSRSLKVQTTLSNSFGFGGTNSVLIFRKI